MKRMIKSFFLLSLVVFSLLLTGCAKDQEASELAEVELENAEKTEETAGETGETFRGSAETEIQEENRQEDVPEESAGTSDVIYVHVCGEVLCPGVYELPAGSRIYEAIEAAGGLTGQASESSLNQAALAEDGQQIYIFSKEEAAGIAGQTGGVSSGRAGTDTGSQGQEDGKVSLNTASKEQLMTLNGIGETKAVSIIQYREEHNGFQSLEELMEVDGIKEGTYNKIKDQIKL